MFKKENIKVYIGLLIGVFFLWLTLKQIDFSSSWQFVRQSDKKFILLAFFIYSAAFLFRSFRWKILLSPFANIRPLKLFNYILLGFFMNNVLPLRMGELVRAHISGTKFNLSRSTVLATIVIERLFDGLSFIILFTISLSFLPFPDWAKQSFMIASFVFTAILLTLIAISRNTHKAKSFFAMLPLPAKIKVKIIHIFSNFVDGLSILTDIKEIAKIVLLSIIVWLLEGSVFYSMNFAFDLGLNFFQGILVMLIIGTGAILPTAPGYVGTVEFLGVTSLALLNVNKNLAFGYILVLHSLQFVTIAFWAFISMFREKITLKELLNFKRT